MTKARLTLERAAIHREQATNDERHAEHVQRQLIEKIVPAVVKVVWAVIRDSQQNRADREDNKSAKEQQVKKSAERLAMNTFLRQRILDEPPTPHAPITLKSAPLTFTPEPHPGYDLPHEHRDTRRDHDEEHHAHP